MNNSGFTIDHQVTENRFVIVTQDDLARLEYILLDNHTLDFTHTFVPPSVRGQGHAEALVHAGINWANSQGYTIKASCWYVAKFLTPARQ